MTARHAVILAGGAPPPREALARAWPGWDAGVTLVIAADAGASHAAALGLRVDRLAGDADSIPPALLADLEAAGAEIARSPVDKDETDTELALLSAIDAGAGEITILGGLAGTRSDHALANVGLLAHPALAGRAARLYDEHAARITLLAGPDAAGQPVTAILRGHAGDIVSLIPFGADAAGVTTEGLRFPLRDEVLLLGRTRGVSNVRVGLEARVTVESGQLLVIETPATVRS